MSEHLLSTEIENFITSCQERGLKVKTIIGHRDRLIALLSSIDKNKVRSVEEIDKATITSYIRFQRRINSPSEVDAIKRSIRTFFNWVEQQPDVEMINPGRGTFLPMSERRLRDGISSQDIENLIGTCEKSILGIRDKAIILMLFDTGMRASELCALTISDLDSRFSTVCINNAKPHHSRKLSISKSTSVQIKKYLSIRGPYSPNDFLFTNVNGKKLMPADIYSLFRRRSKKQNRPVNIRPSDLRLTFGQRVYFETHDIVQVATQMGYSNIPEKKYFENGPLDEIQRKMQEQD